MQSGWFSARLFSRKGDSLKLPGNDRNFQRLQLEGAHVTVLLVINNTVAVIRVCARERERSQSQGTTQAMIRCLAACFYFYATKLYPRFMTRAGTSDLSCAGTAELSSPG
jgi:hypothetical protein